uniref:Uncharacterized protein n=1 Tax=Anguilla anguilla TaxID=7936 RepID=A0A0E9V7U4_ANGAN
MRSLWLQVRMPPSIL